MTDLLQTILQAQGGNAPKNLAARFGITDAQASSAITALLPALVSGMQKNVQQQNGFESLLGALSDGHHQRYVEDAQTVYAEETVQEGNGILGHLLGSKDVSRQVAKRASAQTGVGEELLKQMLPVVATMLMGSVSKQTQSGKSVAATGGGGAQGLMGMLTPLLDQSNDGSIVDDVFRIAGGFLKR